MIAIQEFQGKQSASLVWRARPFGRARASGRRRAALCLGRWRAGASSGDEGKDPLEPRDRWPWQQIKTRAESGNSADASRASSCRAPGKGRGAEVIGDVELFARALRRAARKRAREHHRGHWHERQIDDHRFDRSHSTDGGNRCAGRRHIGKPVLDLAAPGAKTVYVLECRPTRSNCRGLFSRYRRAHNLSPDIWIATVRWPITRRLGIPSQARAADGYVAVGVDDDYSQRSTQSSSPIGCRTRWLSRREGSGPRRLRDRRQIV